MKLHQDSGVPVNDEGNDFADLKTFAKHLGIGIKVFSRDVFGEICFETGELNDQTVCLLKNGNHFDVITSLPGFFGENYFCKSCNKSYTRRDKHKCPRKCAGCFAFFSNGEPCSDKNEDKIICKDCNRTFYGEECFKEHKRIREHKDGKDDVVCSLVQKCLDCERLSKSLKAHICGFVVRENCREYSNPKYHRCFIQKKSVKGGNCIGCEENKKCYPCKTRSELYGFFDFETMAVKQKHEVNLAILHLFDGEEFIF